MSTENKNQERKYVPGSFARARKVQFSDGEVEIISISFINTKELGEFVRDNKSEDGSIAFSLMPLRTPKNGVTHSVSLDTFRPKKKTELPKAKTETQNATEEGDLPF